MIEDCAARGPSTGQSSIFNLHSSITHCRRLTRRANSSFPLAFRVLPPAKRDATTALYAFCRATDDLADDPGANRAAVHDWRERLRAALAGDYTHPIHPALHHAVRTFGIDPAHLFAVIDGVEQDLEPVRFATFAELEPYCHRVASAVGLACLPVWGVRGDVRAPAEAAGVAFQITNILRDLGEDLARGRVYLPADDLARFDSPPDKWRDPAYAGNFRAMMRFQCDRAADYYRRAEPLQAQLSADGRAVFGVMFGVYRRLLAEIERRGFDVFTTRVRVGKLTKTRLLLTAWPTKWGLL